MNQAAPDHISDPVGQASTWNRANAITILRLALVPVFVWIAVPALADSDEARLLLATAVFLLAAFTDLVDGELARRHNLITAFGKIADPIADKALTGAALLALSTADRLAWWVTIVIVVREVVVTLLRFWVIQHGVIPASRGGKLKTMLQIIAIASYFMPANLWPGELDDVAPATFMAAAVVVTVLTGLDYAVRAVRLRRTALAALP